MSSPERAAPFYCPYCGEDSIRPWEDPAGPADGRPAHGAWRCEDCTRVFVLRYRGLTGPPGGSAS